MTDTPNEKFEATVGGLGLASAVLLVRMAAMLIHKGVLTRAELGEISDGAMLNLEEMKITGEDLATAHDYLRHSLAAIDGAGRASR